MPPSSDKDHIEDLKRSLYDRNAPDVRTRRKLRFADMAGGVRTDWGDGKSDDKERDDKNAWDYFGSGSDMRGMNDSSAGGKGGRDHYGEGEKARHARSMKLFLRILLGSAIFFILAVGAGAYIFLNGANLISANNIDITISGPVSAPGGAPVTFSVVITNGNSVALEGAYLDVKFPKGVADPANPSAALDNKREDLGDIPPGGTVKRSVSAVLFGEENLQEAISASVTYSVPGSTSVFVKERSYDVLITSSPVIVSVMAPKQVTSGEPFDMTVTVRSNANSILRNVLLKATYPFGYSFASASPRPSAMDAGSWTIGDLPPGSSRSIVVTGKVLGEDSDLRVFRFRAGSGNAAAPSAIAISLGEAEADMTIEKPFVSLAISIDNDQSQSDYPGRFGRSNFVTIRWTNNLPVSLSNLVLSAHLSGSAYDKNLVSSQNGYYRSATDDVVWNQQTDPELAAVSAGQSGTVTFSITPADKSPGASGASPAIIIEARAAADRPGETGVPTGTSVFSRSIKVSSNLALTGRVTRSTGAFSNTGPIPPRAEATTTYTVTWTIGNALNPIRGAVVTASLPPYVGWLRQIAPSEEALTYEQNSGVITWNAGDISPSYQNDQKRSVSFQISFVPSVDQIGQVPILVNKTTLTGTDAWSGADLAAVQEYLTTSFSTDSVFRRGQETVVAQ